MLPVSLKAGLQAHLQMVKRLHEQDLQKGSGRVDLPYVLATKYPNAAAEWGLAVRFPRCQLLSRSADQREAPSSHSREDATGELVEVEPGEAEWLLDVLEAMFDFAFVQPERLKRRKERLNEKLQAMGKPGMKGRRPTQALKRPPDGAT